jgi:hypothetical protein
MKMSKGTAMMNALEEVEDDDMETSSHMDTLVKAHKIMNDEMKMSKVHKMAGRHHKAVTGLKDLQDIYNKKFGGKNAKSTSPEMSGVAPPIGKKKGV